MEILQYNVIWRRHSSVITYNDEDIPMEKVYKYIYIQVESDDTMAMFQ